MNAKLEAKALLKSKPSMTLQELTAYAANLDPKAEEEFWAGVREINPTLYPGW